MEVVTSKLWQPENNRGQEEEEEEQDLETKMLFKSAENLRDG